MKTNKVWSILMMLMIVLGTTISFSSCGSGDDNDGTGTGNNGTGNGNNGTGSVTGVSGTGIYGTWSALLDDEGDHVRVTVVFDKNSASLTWDAPGDGKETKVYDNFVYDEAEKKITMHYCKKIEIDYGSGTTEEEAKDRIQEYYVTWIDNNHIKLGHEPGGYEHDFGILERSK